MPNAPRDDEDFSSGVELDASIKANTLRTIAELSLQRASRCVMRRCLAKKEPRSAEAWYYLGKAEQNLANTNMAKTHFKKALSLQTNHPASLQAIAQMAQAEGKFEEADKIRVTLKEINPQLLEEIAP